MLFSQAYQPIVLHIATDLEGPVIKDAQRAIAARDVTPVLKWINPEDQAEIENVFQMTMGIRSKGDEVQKVADTYFFETLVRIHRRSEGEGFTGLKPAGNVSPPIIAADKALADGEVEALADKIAGVVRESIIERFRHAYEAKQHAEDDVAKGREFVHAYVQFTHFLEGIHHLISNGADHKHQTTNSH